MKRLVVSTVLFILGTNLLSNSFLYTNPSPKCHFNLKYNNILSMSSSIDGHVLERALDTFEILFARFHPGSPEIEEIVDHLSDLLRGRDISEELKRLLDEGARKFNKLKKTDKFLYLLRSISRLSPDKIFDMISKFCDDDSIADIINLDVLIRLINLPGMRIEAFRRIWKRNNEGIRIWQHFGADNFVMTKEESELLYIISRQGDVDRYLDAVVLLAHIKKYKLELNIEAINRSLDFFSKIVDINKDLIDKDIKINDAISSGRLHMFYINKAISCMEMAVFFQENVFKFYQLYCIDSRTLDIFLKEIEEIGFSKLKFVIPVLNCDMLEVPQIKDGVHRVCGDESAVKDLTRFFSVIAAADRLGVYQEEFVGEWNNRPYIHILDIADIVKRCVSGFELSDFILCDLSPDQIEYGDNLIELIWNALVSNGIVSLTFLGSGYLQQYDDVDILRNLVNEIVFDIGKIKRLSRDEQNSLETALKEFLELKLRNDDILENLAYGFFKKFLLDRRLPIYEAKLFEFYKNPNFLPELLVSLAGLDGELDKNMPGLLIFVLKLYLCEKEIFANLISDESKILDSEIYTKQEIAWFKKIVEKNFRLQEVLVREQFEDVFTCWKSGVFGVAQNRFEAQFWDRNPVKDLFLGNYTACCLALGNMNQHFMVDFLFSAGRQFVNVYDIDTGRLVAHGDIILCGNEVLDAILLDNIEIDMTFVSSKEDILDVRYLIFEYIDEISRRLGIQRVFFGAYENDVYMEDLDELKDRFSFVDLRPRYFSAVLPYYLDAFGGQSPLFFMGEDSQERVFADKVADLFDITSFYKIRNLVSKLNLQKMFLFLNKQIKITIRKNSAEIFVTLNRFLNLIIKHTESMHSPDIKKYKFISMAI